MVPGLPHILDLVARGGGGGSGGGGGGGGGIALLGYVPTHLLGAFLRRKLKNDLGFVIMVIGTLAYALGWFFLGSLGAIIGIAALVGGPAGYFGWFGKVSQKVRKRAQKQITQAAASDPAWDEAALTSRVESVFMAFQKDWSDFNIDSIKTYTTANYANHTALMLAAIKQRGRRNQVDNPRLLDKFPTEVDDLPGNSQDRVTYFMDATANDKLIENVNGADGQLFEDDSEFYEYWQFVRSGNSWLLDGIAQSTENKLMIRPDIKAFAEMNSMFYSPDWGWLLLPSRGQLFKGGKFGKSDINNHCIGVYHNLLVELYTYIPKPNSDSRDRDQYLIAQVALPKRYDSLIVEAKSSGYFIDIFDHKPKGYNKLSLEWPDFNKRYNVYATNVEQVTAFELLHPVYMEKLFALPFKVSIEVVDNVVYLYTKDKKADYGTMFSILKDAFQEMRL